MSCICIAEIQGTVNNIVCTWCLHVKYSIFLFSFNKLAFSRQSVIKFPISNLTKIHPVVAELIHTDRQVWQS